MSSRWRLIVTEDGLELKELTEKESLLKLSEDCKFEVGIRTPCTKISMYRIIWEDRGKDTPT